MSKIKDDVKEIQTETKELRDTINGGLAMSILRDYKRDNKTLKTLLLVSILVNIAIVLILR